MNAALLQQWLQTGFRHHQAGRWDEAARWYGKVRLAAPRHFDALHLDGTRALQQGRHEEAAKLLTLARKQGPASAICALRLGVAFLSLGRLAEADGELRQALAIDPKLAEAALHLGQTLRRMGRLEEAIAALRRAIAIRPDYAEAYDRLGALLWGRTGPDAAEPLFRRATELDPKLATAWCNLSVTLTQKGQLSEALAAAAKAIEVNPSFDHAHAARGLALSKCYRPAAAAAAYEQALALNPKNFEAHSARLLELQYESGVSCAELFAAHRRFGEAADLAAARPIAGVSDAGYIPAQPAGGTGRRLARVRVGFLSPDLHRHSVAYFLEPILAHLDRRRFETILFHDAPRHDDVSERLKALADAWHITAGMPAEALEALVRGEGLDVLIDLAGHTGQNRLPLFARRLAPVQATYLGYPDTTGLAAMDGRLVDGITDPEGTADAFATERLVRFAPTAWSYLPPPESPEPSPGPAAIGGTVTFGCFNNAAKMSNATLRLWARILAAVPGSRLLLKGHGLTAPVLRADLVRRMEEAGIPAARLELLERTAGVREHLALYEKVDVGLDTFPYHGTTTTCEALWMGVPVVTLIGERHASRVGASLLTAAGHPEWIARDPDGYVAAAAALAEAAPRARLPRCALREALRRSALMDHAGQAARFGAALEDLHRHQAGKICPANKAA